MAESSGKTGARKVPVYQTRTTRGGRTVRSRVTNIRNRASQRRAGI